MEQFDITPNKTIACYARQLYMRVVDEESITEQDMVIEAQLSGMLGNDRLYFKLLYPNLDRDFTKWSLDLFYDTAEYYCQVVHDKAPTGFSLINEQKFYPYQKEKAGC